MTEKEQAVLVCPDCHSHLIRKENIMVCENCSRSWNILGKGIPSFASQDFYWNQVPREKMPQLLAFAQEEGYHQALKSMLLPETNDYVFRYALDESRADFKFVLPISPHSRVLDVGCGWGAVTVGLARRVGQVWGLDSTLETLEFVKLRTQQEGISNVYLLHTDSLDLAKLPLPTGYFDLVLLNGVLEWIGTQRKDLSPREVQVIALQEIHRVLKPNGTVYIGIENRYSYTYFGGSPDHSGLPFTSLLPRWLANTVLKIVDKRPYRTYTYSRSGYVRLLEESGFVVRKFMVPIPSYREPTYMLDLDHRPSLDFFFQNLILESDSPSKRRKYAIKLSRQLVRFGLFSVFCPCFSITAVKE